MSRVRFASSHSNSILQQYHMCIHFACTRCASHKQKGLPGSSARATVDRHPREGSMNRNTALAAILALSFAATAPAAAQTLKEQIVGAWKMTSNTTTRADG